jgi:hypothetical protein
MPRFGHIGQTDVLTSKYPAFGKIDKMGRASKKTLFMQNKPILKTAKMNINQLITRNYRNACL